MIDASKGFIKDGNKNRLREQDIHRMVDTFTRQMETPRYARMVPRDEIADPKNDFNLNLPRYIDSSEPEDLHDITGHLRGGIPARDLDDSTSPLAPYWQVLPGVRRDFFESAGHAGYLNLKLPLAELRPAILGHAEFQAFNAQAMGSFTGWRGGATPRLKAFGQGGHPKALIATLAEELLAAFAEAPLLDAYDIYQHLMDYWAETMQDDAYQISADGWVAKTTRIIETDKRGRPKDKGWTCDLIPKSLIVARYFAQEQADLDAKQAELEATTAGLAELEEEHGGEEGFLGALEKIAKAEVNARLREIRGDKDAKDEADALKRWVELSEIETVLKREVKAKDAALDLLAYGRYPTLTEAEIKTLAIDDKWMAHLQSVVQGELDRVSQTLTGRIRELAERYGTPLPILTDELQVLATKVEGHLRKMGLSWQ
jgi:type I restriction enzyme M protein